MWSIIKEEWRSVWHDEGVTLIVVFALFIYGISYSLGYGGEVLNEVPIAVVEGGQGSMSRRLVRMFDASPKLRVTYDVQNMEEAEALLRERRVWGIVALSPNFEIDILAKRQSKVAIVGDASYFLAYREVVDDCFSLRCVVWDTSFTRCPTPPTSAAAMPHTPLRTHCAPRTAAVR